MTVHESVSNFTNVPEPIFLGFVSKLQSLTSEKDSIVGKIRALKKSAKADGIDLKAAEKALKIAALMDEEARAEHNTTLAYMKFLRLPIGSQLSFLDGNDDDISEMSEKQRQTKWFDDGWACSARGGNRVDCPHDPTSDAGQAWQDGYQANQRHILEGIRHFDEKPEETPAEQTQVSAEEQPPAPPAEPKKRGRPAKEKASIFTLVSERSQPVPPEPPMAA
ncbi:GapR family DNA-binding domain-containing protein [Labrys sp. KB_33_2]|uniref:GapR family DNA-binding domain-containing protein n=1 Tax=Labrys sp. KB_33_2 TaxID=3237479 RepID=UPI003F91F0BE